MQPIIIRTSKKKLRAFKMLCTGVAIILITLLVDSRFRPVLTMLVTNEAKIAATRSVNDAVLAVISNENALYDQIISINMNENGEVVSIETDMAIVNRLKAQLTNEIDDRLEHNTSNQITIPSGSILGGPLFSGRGPEMEFRMVPAGHVQTDIYNRFESAGINQTLHQVMLNVEATVLTVGPVYASTTEISTNICVAETVIVGKVPDAYTKINGDKSDDINLYNDYKAELNS